MQQIETSQFAPRRFPITVRMYHLMAEQGAFGPEERLELIGGEIFDMSPIGNLHARCVKFLTEYFISLLKGQYIVGIQDPVVLDDFSEPQPDISILRYRSDYYRDETPTAGDTFIVVEVADSSVEFDRSIKLRRYAAAGIPEFWLINLAADHVEVHGNPENDAYSVINVYQRGQNVISRVIPEIDLSVDEILG